MTMPAVQYSHSAACFAMNAAWGGSGRSGEPQTVAGDHLPARHCARLARCTRGRRGHRQARCGRRTRDVELLADDLAHGDVPARPDVHLADEDRHRAIPVHGQERVDHWTNRLAEEAVGAGHGLDRRTPQAVEPEADDHHPARGEDAPS
jgi:hypothetical protein